MARNNQDYLMQRAQWLKAQALGIRASGSLLGTHWSVSGRIPRPVGPLGFSGSSTEPISIAGNLRAGCTSELKARESPP